MPLFVVESSVGLSAGDQANPDQRVTASFFAPDGKAGFRVVDSLSAPSGGQAWMTVSLLPPTRQEAGALFVVEERFDPPIDLSQAAPENPNLSPCLQRYEVSWFASYIAADGSQCRCVYTAADADAIRNAYRSAGMPFVRVWPARAQ